MSDETESLEDLIEGSRCTNCGERWKVGLTDWQRGGISVYQARCTNLHGCGLRGPQNHYEDQASDQALKLGLYTDQRHLENRLGLRVAELEAKARQREAREATTRRELQVIARHLLALVEKLETKT